MIVAPFIAEPYSASPRRSLHQFFSLAEEAVGDIVEANTVQVGVLLKDPGSISGVTILSLHQRTLNLLTIGKPDGGQSHGSLVNLVAMIAIDFLDLTATVVDVVAEGDLKWCVVCSGVGWCSVDK